MYACIYMYVKRHTTRQKSEREKDREAERQKEGGRKRAREIEKGKGCKGARTVVTKRVRRERGVGSP